MDQEDVRSGINQAKYVESAFFIFFGEIVIIAWIIGAYFDSWIIGGILFLLMLSLTANRTFRLILSVLLSILWAVLGGFFGLSIGSIGGCLVLGLVGLLAGFGIHNQSFSYIKDISRKDKNATL